MSHHEQGSSASSPQPLVRNPRDKIRQPTGNPKDPYGLGDPEDLSLRKVEKDIMIPMIMRDRAKQEKCSDVVNAFTECCKEAGVTMVYYCRAENKNLKACLTKWYQNEDFQRECTEQFLRERAEYRRTGIKKKDMKRYLA